MDHNGSGPQLAMLPWLPRDFASDDREPFESVPIPVRVPTAMLPVVMAWLSILATTDRDDRSVPEQVLDIMVNRRIALDGFPGYGGMAWKPWLRRLEADLGPLAGRRGYGSTYVRQAVERARKSTQILRTILDAARANNG